MNRLRTFIYFFAFFLGCTSSEIYPNGQIMSSGDSINGEFINYFENGEVKNKGVYVDGKLHGQKFWYYENGQISCIENFANGELNGEYVTFYESGETLTTGAYLNEKKNGLWTTYYLSGIKTNEFFYVNGNPISSTLYYPNGDTIK